MVIGQRRLYRDVPPLPPRIWAAPDLPFRFSYTTSRHGTLRHAGLILIHRLSLSLLFHNHRSLPVPIRGYRVQTLLTYLGLAYTFFLRLFSPPPFPLLPRPHIPSSGVNASSSLGGRTTEWGGCGRGLKRTGGVL